MCYNMNGWKRLNSIKYSDNRKINAKSYNLYMELKGIALETKEFHYQNVRMWRQVIGDVRAQIFIFSGETVFFFNKIYFKVC